MSYMIYITGAGRQMDFTKPHIRAMVPGRFLHCIAKTGFFELSQDNLANLCLSPFNRTIDHDYARSMEEYIRDRVFAGHLVETIKLAVSMEDIANRREATVVPVYITDGQHRWTAMREVYKRYPEYPFTFMAEVDIVRDESEISRIVHALQNVKPMTGANREGISARLKVSAALERCVKKGGETMNRQCIKGVLSSRCLRDGEAVNQAISNMSIDRVEALFMEIGEYFRPLYEADKPTSRTLCQVIERTGLYQLIDPSDQWLDFINAPPRSRPGHKRVRFSSSEYYNYRENRPRRRMQHGQFR